MNYFHIKILTPLHVGSGRTLRSDTEFLKFENVVSVIDDHKILDIIGEENIQQWIDIINNGNDLLDYLKKRSPSGVVEPTQTHKRLLPIVGNYLKPKNGLREQIFSGNGQPLLPGSSLKGAVRTAVINGLIEKQPSIANGVLRTKKEGEKRGAKTVKYGKFEHQLTGKDPNHDSFRLVRIGDAHFDQTVCLLTQTLNQTGNEFGIKEDVNQLVECIPEGAEALSGVSIPADLLKEINKRPQVAYEMKANNEINSWPKIIRHVNRFTKKQLESELRKYNTVSLPNEADAFPETMKVLLEQISNLGENECIIRVGFGTGYLNMTGGWPIEQWKKTLTPDKYLTEMNDLGIAVRKNSKYNSFDLPKSRKIISGGVPMGFVKLTLWSAEQAEAWKSKAAERKAIAEAEQAKEAEAARLKAEQEAETARVAAEEAKKPVMFEGVISKNLEVDAEVIVSARPNRVKIFVKGFDQKQFEMNDSAQQPLGYVCRVALVVEKGKILRVRHLRPK
jgi:CRISPR type III-A-associated RAMP protein Csm5